MRLRKSTFLFLCFITTSQALAQSSARSQISFGEGLTIQGGLSYLSTRDEYISPQRYSGSLPSFAVNWSRFHETYGYRLILEYEHSTELENFSLTAELMQFALGASYLYPVGTVEVFSREIRFFLGPSSELFMCSRHQAFSPYDEVNVYAGLFSGGVRSEAYCPIAKKLQLQGAFSMSILSLGMKTMRDRSGAKTTGSALLTPFSGFRLLAEAGVQTRFYGPCSAAMNYRFEMATMNSWDYFIAAEDKLVVSVSVEF